MRRRRRAARRGVRGPARRALRPLRVRARSARPRRPGRCCRDRASSRACDRRRRPTLPRADAARRIPFSDQQLAAITAPLEPGRGDRRRRLGQDHGDGRARGLAGRHRRRSPPDQVLGPDLHQQGGRRARARGSATALARPACAAAAGDGRATPGRRPRSAVEPTVATYHAYAASLLTEHGLRIGHEPDTRLIADAVALPARRPGDRRAHGPRRAAHRPARRPSIDDLLALDAELTEHLVTTDDVRALRRRERPRFEAALRRARGQDRASRKVLERDRASARSCSTSSRTTARLKRELGLMDFSDQIALGARLAERAARGRSASSAAKFRVVLLDEYQDTSVAQARLLARCSPGPTRRPDAATRSPRSATPTRRSTAGAAPRSPTSSASAPTSRAADGRRRADVPAQRQPALRRAHPRRRQRAWPQPLYAASTRSRPLEPERRRRSRATVAARSSTRRTPTSWPGWPTRSRRAHACDAEPPWSEIGVLTRDNAHAADVFDALTARRDPGRGRRPPGPAAAARGRRGGRHARGVHDPTANAALLTPAHRAALGDRAARPRAARPPGARAGPGPSRGRTTGADVAERARGGRRGRRPDRGGLAERRARRPRRRAPTPPRPASGSRCWPASCATCARTPASRCSTWSAGSSTSPGSTSSWPRRLSRAAARPPRQPRPVRQGGRGVPGDRRRRSRCRRCWPTSTAEDEYGAGPRRGHPDRGRLGQAAHRAPGQGPGVGRRCSWSACARAGSPAPRPRTQWTDRAGVLPDAAARRRARPARSCAATTSRRSTRSATPPRQHEPIEELRLGYVAFTRARHLLLGVVVPAGARRSKTPLGPSPLPARRARARSAAWGEPSRAPGTTSRRKGHANPLRGGARRAGRGRCTERTAAQAAAPRSSRGRAGARPTGRRRSAADDRARPGRRQPAVAEWDDELERLLAEARARPRPTWSTVPLPRSLSATALARLRDDPTALAARPGPADAAAALAGGAVRHPLPRLGRGALRPAGPARPRRPARPGRRGDRRRRRPARS